MEINNDNLTLKKLIEAFVAGLKILGFKNVVAKVDGLLITVEPAPEPSKET
jgi:hypothetical protein